MITKEDDELIESLKNMPLTERKEKFKELKKRDKLNELNEHDDKVYRLLMVINRIYKK